MFTPINDAHAIAEMVVFYEFNPDLTEVLPSLLGLKELLGDAFPRSETTQGFRMEVGPGGGTLKQLPSGLQLSRFRTNGSLEWMINVGPTAVSFHCLDYTRWDPVWERMKSYIKQVFHEMGAAQAAIAAVGLKYVDRFVWDGGGEYDARQLFRAGTLYLHDRAFQSGIRWHCHSGWFHQDHPTGEILNQLNVDSGYAMIEGATTVLVSIDHTQTLRRQTDHSLDSFGRIVDQSSEPLDALMKYMHAENKNALMDLLSDRVAKRIKLQGAHA